MNPGWYNYTKKHIAFNFEPFFDLRNLATKKAAMEDRNPKCVCKQENEIGKLRADVNNLLKAVMGNGQPGLIVTVPRLAENVERFEQTAGEFATAVRGFHQFQESEIGRQRGKAEIRRRNRWIIGILITLSTSLLGTVVLLILKLFQTLHSI